MKLSGVSPTKEVESGKLNMNEKLGLSQFPHTCLMQFVSDF